jgi:hypothetical protein
MSSWDRQDGDCLVEIDTTWKRESTVDADDPVVRLCAQGMQAEVDGRDGDARALFRQAWEVATDDYGKCIAAHYLARQQNTLEQAMPTGDATGASTPTGDATGASTPTGAAAPHHAAATVGAPTVGTIESGPASAAAP